jgi:tetratricopeptide (TPR) repeat protein
MAEENEVQPVFLGMASLIDETPTQKNRADGYLTYYEQITNHPGFLDSAAVHLDRAEEAGAEVTASRIQLWFLQQDFGSIVRAAGSMSNQEIDDAWTAYRIGDAFLAVGQPGKGLPFLQRAVELAPAHLRFLNKLAAGYHQDAQTEAAISTYDRVLAAHPKFHEAYNNRGFARIILGDADGAESDFLAALALEPDEVQTIANLASLYYNTGRLDDARTYAERLLQIEPSNPAYLQLWQLLN